MNTSSTAVLPGPVAAADAVAGTGSPIVVGIDGSACARHAVEWAAAQARAQGRPLELIHVRPPGGFPGPAAIRSAVRGEAQRTAARLQADGVPTRLVLTDGEPGQVLVRRSLDAGMLVLGAWGAGSRLGLLLGDVAQHCARHSRCPVVLVPLPGR